MDVKPGYKQTDVGIIPSDWSVNLLPEVCKFRSGKAHEPYVAESGPFVCVNSKFISTEGKVRKHCSRNVCGARLNDVLMVMSDLPNGRALAKAFLADADSVYAVNQRVCALTAYRDCPRYLFYVLNRNPYFLKFDDGVNQTHLLNRVFEKCPIALPPTLAEQEAIANALSDADALIESLEQLLDKKRQVKQGAMQELLTGKRRLPGFASKTGYQQTDAGVIPEDWELRPLLSAVRVASGQVDPRSEPYRSMILVAPDHIQSRSGRLLEQVTAADQLAISGKYCFDAGDIVYSKIRPYLRKAILAGFAGLCSADMYPLKPATDIAAGFVFAALLGHHFSKYAESVSVRSGMPKINREEMAAYVLALPSTKAEQEAIATVLSDMDADIVAMETKLAKANQVKQGMMQELLTGRIRLVDPRGATA